MNTNRNLTAFLIALSLCISLTACSAAETNSFLTTSDTAVTTETITEETTEASEDDDRPGDLPDGERPDAPLDGKGGGPGGSSSADIDYSGAVGITSDDTQAGKNSIELTNCDLSANNTKCNGNATFFDTIIIYQSMTPPLR
ncbi:MAG: hypothetical protein K5695_10945 [Oscillospiraceae bacterium]|nr:hypothetical protein [Oscillospiraceae bacterium]